MVAADGLSGSGDDSELLARQTALGRNENGREFPDRSLLRQALQDIDRIQDIIPGDVPVGHHADS